MLAGPMQSCLSDGGHRLLDVLDESIGRWADSNESRWHGVCSSQLAAIACAAGGRRSHAQAPDSVDVAAVAALQLLAADRRTDIRIRAQFANSHHSLVRGRGPEDTAGEHERQRGRLATDYRASLTSRKYRPKCHGECTQQIQVGRYWRP